MSWVWGNVRKLVFLCFWSASPKLVLALLMAGALSLHAAPTRITIVTQPKNQLVSPGQTATFKVAAITHSGTLSFQWFSRHPKGRYASVPGATFPSYTTHVLSLSDNRSKYFVQVNNGRARTASREAVLRVRPTISIITQPMDQVVSPGQTATFTVVATTDAGKLTYQWFCNHHSRKNVAIPGATSPSYTTPILDSRQNGSEFFVRISNSGARVKSRHALLTVKSVAPPATPLVSLDTYVTTGKAGLVARTKSQGTDMTYVWTLTGGTISSGQGTPAITYTAGAAGTTLTASVRVTNGSGSASGSASARVVPSPCAELALPLSTHPGDGWMKASVPIQVGMTYLWTVIPGTSTASITSGQGTGVIGFSASTSVGTFQIQANVQNLAGDQTTSTRTVTIETGTWLVKNGGASVARSSATATLLPSGRVLVAGGTRGVNGTLASAEIYDPATGTWTTTASMGTARSGHAAILLLNGTVLVVGGDAVGTSAEIYDPAKGTWTTTASLLTARFGQTTTLLPDGTVLVAGGIMASKYLALTSAEIYDPAKETWTATASLGTARFGHTATLLPNGTVLVAGGHRAGIPPYEPILASAEIYDPAKRTWATTASLGTARNAHTATLLASGTVLVVGGDADSGYLASAELYDPAKGTWAATASLATARFGQTTTLLPDGTVLVAGGVPGASGYPLATAEIYDPSKETWTSTASLGTARIYHTTTLLPDGTVLVAGGDGASGYISSTEIYSPAKGTWTTTASLGTARIAHTSTLLPNGAVLVSGGVDSQGNGLASAGIYNPTKGTWTPTASLGTSRNAHTATLLADGTVLVAGGWGTSELLGITELYDPAKGTWTPTASLGTSRNAHTATLLADGTVLVAGGVGASGYASEELYNPTKGTWTATASLGTARFGHTATLLADGTVLVAGGEASGYLASAEIYDPAKGTWTPTGSLGTARWGHTATLLPNGTVLVAGGYGASGYPASAEIYDPAKGTWTVTASLGTARISHTATLLPNGTVLVAGGSGGSGYLASAEIYDPAKGTWTSTGNLETARESHTATKLNDGTIMVAFGQNGDTVTEIYRP